MILPAFCFDELSRSQVVIQLKGQSCFIIVVVTGSQVVGVVLNEPDTYKVYEPKKIHRILYIRDSMHVMFR